MVFILDEGSTFKAPLEKVGKLNAFEGQHNHASLKNLKAEPAGENTMMVTYEVEIGSKLARAKTKLTAVPPVGMITETLEGPFAGSKSFQF